jgi:hypothetical protein
MPLVVARARSFGNLATLDEFWLSGWRIDEEALINS